MQRVEPIGTNVVLHSLFSSSFIEPEVVIAYEALLETNRVYLEGLEIEESTYLSALLSFLAPNEESRLANFGRSTAQEDKKQKRSHTSAAGGNNGRRTKPGKRIGPGVITTNLMKKVYLFDDLIYLFYDVIYLFYDLVYLFYDLIYLVSKIYQF